MKMFNDKYQKDIDDAQQLCLQLKDISVRLNKVGIELSFTEKRESMMMLISSARLHKSELKIYMSDKLNIG